MAWIRLNTVFFSNGSERIQVYDPLEAGRIQEGWALLYQGEVYEIQSATTNESVPHDVYLREPWQGNSDGPVAVQVIPINARFEEVLYRYETAVDYLDQWRLIFDPLTWREAKDLLQVTDDGQRIRPISMYDLFGRMISEFGSEVGEAAQSAAIAQLRTDVLQPVGGILPYRFDDFPDKYLELNGAIQQYDEYPELGALYGANPGETFQLDDWRGLPLWGGTEADVGSKTGSNIRDLSHDHDMQHAHPLEPENVGSLELGSSTQLAGIAAPEANPSRTGSALGEIDVRPERALVRWLIRARP